MILDYKDIRFSFQSRKIRRRKKISQTAAVPVGSCRTLLCRPLCIRIPANQKSRKSADGRKDRRGGSGSEENRKNMVSAERQNRTAIPDPICSGTISQPPKRSSRICGKSALRPHCPTRNSFGIFPITPATDRSRYTPTTCCRSISRSSTGTAPYAKPRCWIRRAPKTRSGNCLRPSGRRTKRRFGSWKKSPPRRNKADSTIFSTGPVPLWPTSTSPAETLIL